MIKYLLAILFFTQCCPAMSLKTIPPDEWIYLDGEKVAFTDKEIKTLSIATNDSVWIGANLIEARTNDLFFPEKSKFIKIVEKIQKELEKDKTFEVIK